MTIVVNPHNEQEEKVLLAFLESLQYDYQASNEDDVFLTEAQQEELLRRHADFKNGKTEARLLNDVLNDIERVYR
jgi:hypothetical protein